MSAAIEDRRRVAGGGLWKRPRLVNRAALDRGQFLDVAADVPAVAVVAVRLPERVECAAATRVRSGAGDPLPVTNVVCDVAVDESVEEVSRL
jgi:hypothetical protein